MQHLMDSTRSIWIVSGFPHGSVTHWTPIPEAPQKAPEDCTQGHDWMNVPLSDYAECRRCGVVREPPPMEPAEEEEVYVMDLHGNRWSKQQGNNWSKE